MQCCFIQGYGGRFGYFVVVYGYMLRNILLYVYGNWMNRVMGGGGGRMLDFFQSRGMNDVFVIDNGFRFLGLRFDDFSLGGMLIDRVGFGLR